MRRSFGFSFVLFAGCLYEKAIDAGWRSSLGAAGLAASFAAFALGRAMVITYYEDYWRARLGGQP